MREYIRPGSDLFITTDREAVELDFLHGMLSTSYWAAGRSREKIASSVAGSIPFSLFNDAGQIGFARVVTDSVTFAWVADVVIHPEHRGVGFGSRLIRYLLSHPTVAHTTQQLLRTRDAHLLYERAGFETGDCMFRRSPP